QALGTDARQRIRIERGLGMHHRADDRLLHAELLGRGLYLAVVGSRVQPDIGEVQTRRATGTTGLEKAVADGPDRAATTTPCRLAACVVAHPDLDVGIALALDQAARARGRCRRCLRRR